MKTLAMQCRAMLLCASLLLMLPAMSFAGGPTCPLATGLIPDGRSLSLDYVQPNNGTVWYSFSTTAGHSYSVEVRDDLDGAPATPELTITFYSAACSTLMAPGTPPYGPNLYRDTSSIEPKVIPNTGLRISIPNPNSDTIAIKVVNGNASMGHYVSVSVSETTIYSSNWNTNSGFNTQFILQNTTSYDIAYTLTLTATQVTGGPYIASGTLSAPPSSSSNAILSTLSGFSPAVPPNDSGYVVLTHNGPPGALQVYENENNFGTFTSPVLFLIPFGPLRGK